jgi:hypothetical protein
MEMIMAYEGTCFCGAVAVRVSGEPVKMGYCHCGSCRSWSAGPVNAFTLWPEANVEVTRGGEFLATYHKTETSYRKYCTKCGGHVMTAHPGGGIVDVYAATLPGLAFTPELHVHYGETVLPIRDGLPKFRDMPEAFGGSGDIVAE